MSIQPLKEGERFVIRDLVYKVIRARINGKLTIKLKGIYTPRGPTGITPLTPVEKKEEQKFFKEKEEPKDGKKDDSGTREEPVPGEESNNSSTTGSQLPRADGDRPTFG